MRYVGPGRATLHLGIAILLLLAALAQSGCGGDDEDDAGETADGPALELTDAGAEPRRVLELAGEPGESREHVIRMDTSMRSLMQGQDIPDQEAPTTEAGLTTSVQEVEGGEIVVGLEYGDVRVDEGADDEVAGQIQQAMGILEGTTGRIRVTSHGRVEEARVGEASDDSPAAAMLRQFEEQVSAMVPQFPEEPVGAGASWQVTSTPPGQDVPSRMTVTYTLEELDGDDYVLSTEVEVTMEPGPLGNDGRLAGGRTTGTGSMEGSLSFPVPLRTEARSTSRLHIDNFEGRVLQTVETGFALEPAG